jgi:hypothetical protein
MTAGERPLSPGEALAKLFLDNADRGANAANDELVAALRERARAIRALTDHPHPTTAGIPGPAAPPDARLSEGFTPPMTAEQSRRFALTGHDPEGRNRTIILWREVDLVEGSVVRRVVVTLDATMTTATVLTYPEAVEVAQAILAAAQ